MENNKPFEKFELSNIKNIIVVASGKGGVGKSTVATGLALSLALEGHAVGLLDADIYGPSMPTIFNLHNERPEVKTENGKNTMEPIVRYGIKLMSLGFFVDISQPMLWRGPLAASGLKQLMNDTEWGELDYLIIDTPPGTGDIHITLLQQYNINGVVIVTTPQLVALSDVQKAISMFRDPNVGVPVLGVVENMSWFTPVAHPDEKYFLFGKGGGEKLAKKFNIPLLAQIPINEKLCESCDWGDLDQLFNDPLIKRGFDDLIKAI